MLSLFSGCTAWIWAMLPTFRRHTRQHISPKIRQHRPQFHGATTQEQNHHQQIKHRKSLKLITSLAVFTKLSGKILVLCFEWLWVTKLFCAPDKVASLCTSHRALKLIMRVSSYQTYILISSTSSPINLVLLKSYLVNVDL
jgi:hypothetical protein